MAGRKVTFASPLESPSKITKLASSTTDSETLSSIYTAVKAPLEMPTFSSLQESPNGDNDEVSASVEMPDNSELTTSPALRRTSTLTLEDAAQTCKSTEERMSRSKSASLSKESSSLIERDALVTRLSGLKSGSIVGETSLASMSSLTKNMRESKSLSRRSSSVKSTDSSSSRMPSVQSGWTNLELPSGSSKNGGFHSSVSTFVSNIDETQINTALGNLKTILFNEGLEKGSISKSAPVRSISSSTSSTQSDSDAMHSPIPTASTSSDKESENIHPSDQLIEVAISFDTTESMYSCLEEVKAKIQDLVQRLQTDIPGIRVAIIAHGDYCDEHIYVVKWIDFGASLPELCDFVNNVERTSGGDGPECYELVLQRSREVLSWTEGSKRILVMIGDSVPHEPGYSYGGKTYHINWRDECAALKEMGVKIYAVQASNWSFPTKLFYTEMARLTGGMTLRLTNFNCLFDFLMMICYREGNPEKLADYEREIIDRREGVEDDIMLLKEALDRDQKEDLILSTNLITQPSSSLPSGTSVFGNMTTYKQHSSPSQMMGTSQLGVLAPMSRMGLPSQQPMSSLPKALIGMEIPKQMQAQHTMQLSNMGLQTYKQHFPSQQMMLSSPMGLPAQPLLQIGTNAFGNVTKGNSLSLDRPPQMLWPPPGLAQPSALSLGICKDGEVAKGKKMKTKLPKTKKVAVEKTDINVKANKTIKAGKKTKKLAGISDKIATGTQLFQETQMTIPSPVGFQFGKMTTGIQLLPSPQMLSSPMGLQQLLPFPQGPKVTNGKQSKTKLPKVKKVGKCTNKHVRASKASKAGKKTQAGKSNKVSTGKQLPQAPQMMIPSHFGSQSNAFGNMATGNQLFSSPPTLSSPMLFQPPPPLPLGTNGFGTMTAGNQAFPSPLMSSSPVGPSQAVVPGRAKGKQSKTKLQKAKKVVKSTGKHVKANKATNAKNKMKTSAAKSNKMATDKPSPPLGNHAFGHATKGNPQPLQSSLMQMSPFGLSQPSSLSLGTGGDCKVTKGKKLKTKLSKTTKVAVRKTNRNANKTIKAGKKTNRNANKTIKAGKKTKKQAGKSEKTATDKQLPQAPQMMIPSHIGFQSHAFGKMTTGNQFFSSPPTLSSSVGLPQPPPLPLGTYGFGTMTAGNQLFSSSLMLSSPFGPTQSSPLPLVTGRAKGKQSKTKLQKAKTVVKNTGKHVKANKATNARNKMKTSAAKSNKVATDKQLFQPTEIMLSSPMGLPAQPSLLQGNHAFGHATKGNPQPLQSSLMQMSPFGLSQPSPLSLGTGGDCKVTKGKKLKTKLPKTTMVAVIKTNRNANKTIKAGKKTKKQAGKSEKTAAGKQLPQAPQMMIPSHIGFPSHTFDKMTTGNQFFSSPPTLSSSVGLSPPPPLPLGTNGFGTMTAGNQLFSSSLMLSSPFGPIQSSPLPLVTGREKGKQSKTKLQKAKTVVKSTGKHVKANKATNTGKKIRKSVAKSNKMATDKHAFGHATKGNPRPLRSSLMQLSPFGLSQPSPLSLGTGGYCKVTKGKNLKTKLPKTMKVTMRKSNINVKANKAINAGKKTKKQAGKSEKTAAGKQLPQAPQMMIPSHLGSQSNAFGNMATGNSLFSSPPTLSSSMLFQPPRPFSLGTNGFGTMTAVNQVFPSPPMLSSPFGQPLASPLAQGSDIIKGKPSKTNISKTGIGKHAQACKATKTKKKTEIQAAKTNKVTTGKKPFLSAQMKQVMLAHPVGHYTVINGNVRIFPILQMQPSTFLPLRPIPSVLRTGEEVVAKGKQFKVKLRKTKKPSPSPQGVKEVNGKQSKTKLPKAKRVLKSSGKRVKANMATKAGKKTKKQVAKTVICNVKIDNSQPFPPPQMKLSPFGLSQSSPLALKAGSYGGVAKGRKMKTKLPKPKEVAVKKADKIVKANETTKTREKTKKHDRKMNKREKLPDSCMNEGVLETITWSKWNSWVEPTMPTSKKKAEFVKLRTNQGYGLKTIFDNDFKTPAIFEVAVQLPGSRKKHIVYYQMTKPGFNKSCYWSTNSLQDKMVRDEVNRVLNDGCSLFIRRGVPATKKDDKYVVQMQAANEYIEDNFDYAWKIYMCRRSESGIANFGLKHRLLKTTSKGKEFTLSDNDI